MPCRVISLASSCAVLAALLLVACGDDGASGADTGQATDAIGTAADDTRVAADTGLPADSTSVATDTAVTTAAEDTAAPADTSGPQDTVVGRDTSGPRDTETSRDTASPDTTAPACTRFGFDPVVQIAEGEVENGAGFAAWTAANSDTVPFDRMTLELLDVPHGPFSFRFAGQNYKVCSVCLTLGASCQDAGCVRTFQVHDGALDVTTWDEAGGDISGALRDLVAYEVTIGEDFVSERVPNGQVWCIDAVDFNATLDPF